MQESLSELVDLAGGDIDGAIADLQVQELAADEVAYAQVVREYRTWADQLGDEIWQQKVKAARGSIEKAVDQGWGMSPFGEYRKGSDKVSAFEATGGRGGAENVKPGYNYVEIRPGLMNELEKDLDKWGYSGYQIERLARTEYTRAMNDGLLSIYQEDDAVVGYEWSAIADLRTCVECAMMNGVIMDRDDPRLAFYEPPLHANCYDSETELYTDRGWMKFEDLKDDELVLSLNPETHEMEWLPYVRKVQYDYKGKMYHLHGKWFDLMVTPDHMQFHGSRNSNTDRSKLTWKSTRMEDLVKKFEFSIARTGGWTGNASPTVKINGMRMDAGDFAEFMGYWLSEGSVCPPSNWSRYRWQIQIAQKDGAKKDVMWDLISRMPFERKSAKAKDRISIYNDRLGDWLAQFGKAHEKTVPEEIKCMDRGKIKRFLDAYLLGDGSVRQNTWQEKDCTSMSRRFATSSHSMAGDLGELILKVGGYPSFGIVSKAGTETKHRNGTYRSNHDVWVVSWNTSKTAIFGKGKNNRIDEVDYDGMVYDITLPRNHVFWVRRNGKTCFSNNCRCELLPLFAWEMEEPNFDKMREVTLYDVAGKSFTVDYIPNRIDPDFLKSIRPANDSRGVKRQLITKARAEGLRKGFVSKDPVERFATWLHPRGGAAAVEVTKRITAMKPKPKKPKAVTEPTPRRKPAPKKKVPVARTSALTEKVRGIEAKIVTSKAETGVALDAQGKVLLRKVGIADRVEYTFEEFEKMRGTVVFTHNHPTSRTFSPNDLRFASELKVGEMRATSRLYNYSLKLDITEDVVREIGEKYHMTPAQYLVHENHVATRAVRRRLDPLVASGRVSPEDGNLIVGHQAMNRVNRRVSWIQYSRRKVK